MSSSVRWGSSAIVLTKFFRKTTTKAADVKGIRAATRLFAIFQVRRKEKILDLCMCTCVQMEGQSSEIHLH